METSLKDNLMSVRELADYLRLDKQTIYRKMGKNELPPIPFLKIGTSYRFRKEDIDAWLKRQGRVK